MQYQLHHGDCLAVLAEMPDSSVDSIVTDPPYELGFMGKSWDASGIAYNVDMWREALRVLKPGGHLLAFSGSRTYHRMTCAIEDAGFEIRDQIMWVYGSGFPKSLDVSKAIDKAGPPGQAPFAEFAEHYEARRKALGLTHSKICAAGGWHGAVNHGGSSVNWANGYGFPTIDQWLVLQPLLGLDEKWKERVERVQYEREVLGIKPGTKLAVAPGQENDRGVTQLAITAAGSDAARQWEGWGTALKPAHEPICVARKPLVGTVAANVLEFGTGALNIDASRIEGRERTDYGLANATRSAGNTYGTPTESADFDSEKGRWPANFIHAGLVESWSRYFYCAKASKSDRGAGNVHPTVKPTELMRYLVRLVTPPGGVVLDPFMGSGSTGKAAMREGFRFVGTDMTAEYVEIARARIEHALFGDLL